MGAFSLYFFRFLLTVFLSVIFFYKIILPAQLLSLCRLLFMQKSIV